MNSSKLNLYDTERSREFVATILDSGTVPTDQQTWTHSSDSSVDFCYTAKFNGVLVCEIEMKHKEVPWLSIKSKANAGTTASMKLYRNDEPISLPDTFYDQGTVEEDGRFQFSSGSETMKTSIHIPLKKGHCFKISDIMCLAPANTYGKNDQPTFKVLYHFYVDYEATAKLLYTLKDHLKRERVRIQRESDLQEKRIEVLKNKATTTKESIAELEKDIQHKEENFQAEVSNINESKHSKEEEDRSSHEAAMRERESEVRSKFDIKVATLNATTAQLQEELSGLDFEAQRAAIECQFEQELQESLQALEARYATEFEDRSAEIVANQEDEIIRAIELYTNEIEGGWNVQIHERQNANNDVLQKLQSRIRQAERAIKRLGAEPAMAFES